jgi:uncharacterized membrane protein
MERKAQRGRGRRAHDRPSDLARIVERNIRALEHQRLRREGARPPAARVADAVTRFTGSMPFVYIHLVLFGAWIAVNVGWTPLPRFDPLVRGAGDGGVGGGHLPPSRPSARTECGGGRPGAPTWILQVSLLAENEVTRLIARVTAISREDGRGRGREPRVGRAGPGRPPREGAGADRAVQPRGGAGEAERGAVNGGREKRRTSAGVGGRGAWRGGTHAPSILRGTRASSSVDGIASVAMIRLLPTGACPGRTARTRPAPR